MSAPGSSASCYTAFPPKDASYQSISVACNHENLQQRSLCVATVDLATDTLRANVITVNELQATDIILGDPITSGSFVDSGTVGPQTIAALAQVIPFTGLPGGTAIALTVEDANNVSLDPSASGVIVGEDGWYQVSIEMQNALTTQAGADPTTSFGIGINGLAGSFIGLGSMTPAVATTVSGSTLVYLTAGDLVQIFVSLAVNLAETVSAGPVRLEVARVGP